MEESFLFLDEVGRGPLAGPVVSACVYYHFDSNVDLKNDLSILKKLKITDSKKITKLKRRKILSSLDINLEDFSFSKIDTPKLFNGRLSLSLSQATVEEIDEINILQASLLSMKRAAHSIIRDFAIRKSITLVDGNKSFEITDSEVMTLVKGDLKSLFIALASIYAKETRDFLMEQYSLKYPEYGFEKHSGYPTSFHREQISKFGPSEIHRKSFKLL